MEPDFKKFKELSRNHSLVPTFMELPSDLDTPVSIYLKLFRPNTEAVLLESVEGGGRLGRYSFISNTHHFRFECRDNFVRVIPAGRDGSGLGSDQKTVSDPLLELKRIFSFLKPASLSGLPRFCGGAVGMVSYDMVRKFEALPDLSKTGMDVPHAVFLFTDECIVFDHWKHKLILIKWNRIEGRMEADLAKVYRKAESSLLNLEKRMRNASAGNKFSASKRLASRTRIESNLSVKEFCHTVKRAKDYIRAGDVIQTVLSQRFETDSRETDPFGVYRALRMINPSPYLYFLDFMGFSIAGSSPELLVRKDGDLALTRPIAGTRPRGTSDSEDEKLKEELLNDPKEKAEHLMLVDLGRNDLGRCCEPGSVKVPDFMSVEKYSHVMHLVSTVEGVLRKGEDAFSLFRAAFPAGTLTGAPKIRAMEIIEELENVHRGVYGGSVGYFSYSGDMDMAITIRTLLFKGKKVYMQAGAGIVADSVPLKEEHETRAKAAALFKAVEFARNGLK